MLPKGGWETDEATAGDAAKREAWEEAGIDPNSVAELRPLQPIADSNGKRVYYFFEATVTGLLAQWPEMNQRARMWMTVDQAKMALREREELYQALMGALGQAYCR